MAAARSGKLGHTVQKYRRPTTLQPYTNIGMAKRLANLARATSRRPGTSSSAYNFTSAARRTLDGGNHAAPRNGSGITIMPPRENRQDPSLAHRGTCNVNRLVPVRRH